MKKDTKPCIYGIKVKDAVVGKEYLLVDLYDYKVVQVHVVEPVNAAWIGWVLKVEDNQANKYSLKFREDTRYKLFKRTELKEANSYLFHKMALKIKTYQNAIDKIYGKMKSSENEIKKNKSTNI